MPPASLALYEAGGAALLAQFAFETGGGPVPAGGVSAAVPFELWNSKGNAVADTAAGVSLYFLESPPGLADWNQRGRPSMERWLEFRLTGVLGEADPQVTGWTPAGTGRPFLCNPIPADSARVGEVRLRVPPGEDSTPQDRDFLLAADYQRPAVALGLGFEEAGLRGVRTGTGDGLVSYLVEGLDATPSGAPDEEVHLADGSWHFRGVPHQRLAYTVVTDGDAADGALGSGQAYWLALTAGAGPDLTETRGNKGAAPLGPETRPELPEGESFVAYVHRHFDGVIEIGDIYQDDRAYGRLALYGSGLERTVGTGGVLADNYYVRVETPRPVTFPADTADVALWLLPSTGALSLVTDGSRPDPRALLLGRGETDGSTVTWQDLRPLLGPRLMAVRFIFSGELAEDQEAHATLESESGGYLRLPAPVVASIRAHGTATAGQTVWEIERFDAGLDDWVSLFSSSGTVDRRPVIEHDAADLVTFAARPEDLELLPFERLRARIIEVPTSGTAPAGADLLLFVEVK